VPCCARIGRHVTPEVIAAIGREHTRGRRLFIGTGNLDAGRPVIWNIGAIANSGYERRIALIHDVLQASSAIPVAFPPKVLPVQTAGRQYDEMHVDGGTASQVFVYPGAMDWKAIIARMKAVGVPEVYVIRNAFLDPDYDGVKRNILPIATRSTDSLIRTQGVGDLYQIDVLCERDGNDFSLAWIPADFTEEPAKGFDPVYMGKLYQRGYEMARGGHPWQEHPPGFLQTK